MSESETVDFLATVPLLEGRAEDDLLELARATRRRAVQEGELLWGQGDEAREMVFVVDGALSVSLRVPGDRTVEIGTAGPGEVVGEIGLLDGKGHTMSVRATEAATMLALARVDFVALLARQDPSAFRLKRRLASHLTARLRNQLATSLSRSEAVVQHPLRRIRRRRSSSRTTAARLTARTCVAWRPSTTSSRWRSGAS